MTNFASDAVLQRFMSVYGIATYADHDGDGNADTGVLDDCKLYSVSMIAGQLADKYSFASLQQSPLMIEIDAVITLRELCLRRGNAPPASLEFKYQEFTGEKGTLERIATGKLKLVDGNGERIAQRSG